MNGQTNDPITLFFAAYPEPVTRLAFLLRRLLRTELPDVQEVLDLPARMIAYTYGPRYADMVCTLIPSRKEVKLGFYKGPELPDPCSLLQGDGKLSRYVPVRDAGQIADVAVTELVRAALAAYRNRQKRS